MFCVVCMERYLDGRGKIYRLGAQECGTLKFERNAPDTQIVSRILTQQIGSPMLIRN